MSSKSPSIQWTLNAPSPRLFNLICWPWCANRSRTSIRPTGRALYWELSLSGIHSVTVRLQLTHLPPSRVSWPLHHSASSLVCALPLPGRQVPVCHWSLLWTIQSFPNILDISSSFFKFRWKKPFFSMKPLWFWTCKLKYNWKVFAFCPFLRLFYLFIHFQTFSYFFWFLSLQVEETHFFQKAITVYQQ